MIIYFISSLLYTKKIGIKYVRIYFTTILQGDNFLIIGERASERDTIRGNKWKSEIYISYYIDTEMY